MRFLFALCLALFSISVFAQTTILIPPAPERSGSHDAGLATPSTSGAASAAASAQQLSAGRPLADAPSAIQPSTCTQNNGKLCPEWVYKLVGQYPPIDQTRQAEYWNPPSDHFFTFGNARRVLHPDKKSWVFFSVAQAGMWISTIAAVRDHRTSGEDPYSEYPAVAFMTGIDLLVFKTISPAMSVGPPVYAMVHYSNAAAK